MIYSELNNSFEKSEFPSWLSIYEFNDSGLSDQIQVQNGNKKYKQTFDMQNNPNNSIDQLLEIFKYYRSEAKFSQGFSFNFNEESLETDKKQNTSNVADQFSFSKELPKIQYGVHSSLQKIDKRMNYHSSTRSKRSHLNDSQDSTIFTRLYDEDKAIRQKRQKLFQEGRRSLEKQQVKECTFVPNLKTTKIKTERSFNADDCEGFFQKNMEWQTRRELSIKKKQCEKNSEEKGELTFAPKINHYHKKRLENKENQQFSSTKKKQDSYLNNYHKSNHKDFMESTVKGQNRGVLNVRKGYFSYVN